MNDDLKTLSYEDNTPCSLGDLAAIPAAELTKSELASQLDEARFLLLNVLVILNRDVDINSSAVGLDQAAKNGLKKFRELDQRVGDLTYAIEKHRNNIWGSGSVDHAEDRLLYDSLCVAE